MKKLALKMFYDHIVMILVTFLFTILFGNFLNMEKLIWGYLFSGLTVIIYLLLIYSDVTIIARRNYLNSKGDLSNIDKYLGLKACSIAQISTMSFILILYLASVLNFQHVAIINMFVRAWLVMYVGFFPPDSLNHYILYIMMGVLPIIVAGLGYYIGIFRSKIYLSRN